jgi:FkbM family methyltransferase
MRRLKSLAWKFKHWWWDAFFAFYPKMDNWWLYFFNMMSLLTPGKLYCFKYKNGLRVLFRAGTWDALLNLGIFGIEEYAPLIRADVSHLRQILDLGAQTGLFTLWMLARNPRLHAVCVEAARENYDILCKNIELNGYSSRVRVLHRAAWSRTDELLTLFINPSNTGANSVFGGSVGANSESVLTISLKDIIRNEDYDLVKIDIEGAEYEVLQHTTPATFAHLSRMFMEVHGSEVETATLKSFLEHNGFTVFFGEVQQHLVAERMLSQDIKEAA